MLEEGNVLSHSFGQLQWDAEFIVTFEKIVLYSQTENTAAIGRWKIRSNITLIQPYPGDQYAASARSHA